MRFLLNSGPPSDRKIHPVNRRFALFATLLALLAFAVQPARAGDPTDEIVLGKPKAPITIVEYYSMTCSHCADFDLDTLPQLRKNWIDTGKARFVFRDFPLDKLALRGAMLGRCLAADKGPEAYARFIELLMKGQESWTTSKEPFQALDSSARLAGMSKDKIEACVANKKLETYIFEQQLEAQKKYGIRSTPSFVINGKMYAGAMSIEQFDKLLKEP